MLCSVTLWPKRSRVSVLIIDTGEPEGKTNKKATILIFRPSDQQTHMVYVEFLDDYTSGQFSAGLRDHLAKEFTKNTPSHPKVGSWVNSVTYAALEFIASRPGKARLVPYVSANLQLAFLDATRPVNSAVFPISGLET